MIDKRFTWRNKNKRCGDEMTALPFPRKSGRETEILDLIQSDVCRLTRTESLEKQVILVLSLTIQVNGVKYISFFVTLKSIQQQ